MIARCTNPNEPAFCNYGGRGITVCERWLRFEYFYEDMGDPPSALTIERVDNDSGYSPDNCEWASRDVQANNTRRNRFIVYQGERLTVSQWARRAGISPQTLSMRLGAGWDVEHALNVSALPLSQRDYCNKGHALSQGGVYRTSATREVRCRTCCLEREANKSQGKPIKKHGKRFAEYKLTEQKQ